MQFNLWPAVLLSSVSLAGIYILVALSWTVIFRTTKVFNFAAGEYAVLGAFVFYECTTSLGIPWWPALAITLAVAFLGGGVTYQVLLRPLAGRPLWAPVTLTMGLALIIDAVMSIVWGDQNRQVTAPLPSHTFRLGLNASITTNAIATVAIGLVTYVLVMAGFKWLPVGRRMRSAAESPSLAAQSGIPVHRMYALGWALATAVGALAGILYTMNTTLAPASVSIGLLGLAPALIGGLDSIGGVLPGAIIASLITNFTILYAGGQALDAVSGLVLLAVIVIRPYGLFGTREVVRV